MKYRDPGAILSTEWLEAHLDDSDLRIFDCTVHLGPTPPDPGVPYHPESGRADYEKGHIPNAALLDVRDELSDPAAATFFMFPPEDSFVAALEASGVGEGLRVVFYSAGHIMWATRIWWMLRFCGFAAAMLDGGFEKWQQEGRPLSSERVQHPKAHFAARRRPNYFVDKQAVLDAINDSHPLIVNALEEEFCRGETSSRHGRRGRIPGSVSVPAATLLDSETHVFVTPESAAETFYVVGVDAAARAIAHRGGGISATGDLFLLHQIGYDASMGEWAKDESLPSEQG